MEWLYVVHVVQGQGWLEIFTVPPTPTFPGNMMFISYEGTVTEHNNCNNRQLQNTITVTTDSYRTL